jgi:hypothetical protein
MSSPGKNDVVCACECTTAAQSDAVRACCADPSIQISARGDFTFGDNFMDVMVPYVTSHFEKSHMAEVERYGDFFVPLPQTSKTQEEVFGNDLVESFQEEFGISPGRLAELGMVLLEDAIQQSAVVVVRESASLRQTLAAAGYSESEVEGIWRSFVLGPRDRWNAERCMESFHRSNFHLCSLAMSRSTSADNQTWIPQPGSGFRGSAIAHPLHTPPMMIKDKPLVQPPSWRNFCALDWMKVANESRKGGCHGEVTPSRSISETSSCRKRRWRYLSPSKRNAV